MAGVLGRRAASALAGRVLHNACLQGQAACLHQELQQRCVVNCAACGMLSCLACLPPSAVELPEVLRTSGRCCEALMSPSVLAPWAAGGLRRLSSAASGFGALLSRPMTLIPAQNHT